MLKFTVPLHTDTESVEPHSLLYRLMVLIVGLFCTVGLLVLGLYDSPHPRISSFLSTVLVQTDGSDVSILRMSYTFELRFEPGGYPTP